jgi:hypothetical protein
LTPGPDRQPFPQHQPAVRTSGRRRDHVRPHRHATGDEHFAKTTLYIDAKSRPNWFSGPTFMRVQSVLYGFEEAGFRNADLILRRVGDDRGEAQIVEELCGHAIDRIPAIVG